jgi:hypothetical protein
MARAKRKSASRRGKVENGADTAPVSDGLPPDEVFNRHLLKIRPAVGKLAKLSESVRRQREALSQLYEAADKDGCNRKGFKAALALIDKPADEVSVEQRTVGRILKLIEHPLVTDHGLFPDLPLTPKPPTPYAAGYRVGQSGWTDECPHRPGTEEYIEWTAGHDAGQRLNFDKLRTASQSDAST